LDRNGSSLVHILSQHLPGRTEDRHHHPFLVQWDVTVSQNTYYVLNKAVVLYQCDLYVPVSFLKNNHMHP
jgi:hypothetical protein